MGLAQSSSASEIGQLNIALDIAENVAALNVAVHDIEAVQVK